MSDISGLLMLPSVLPVRYRLHFLDVVKKYRLEYFFLLCVKSSELGSMSNKKMIHLLFFSVNLFECLLNMKIKTTKSIQGQEQRFLIVSIFEERQELQ